MKGDSALRSLQPKEGGQVMISGGFQFTLPWGGGKIREGFLEEGF